MLLSVRNTGAGRSLENESEWSHISERIPDVNVDLGSRAVRLHEGAPSLHGQSSLKNVELLNGRAGYEWLSRAWVMQ
jgi:hypothetical protein